METDCNLATGVLPRTVTRFAGVVRRALILAFVLGAFTAVALSQENSYDVIVVGSEPEGVAAAVAAAQEGVDTLLVTTHPRIGGLFVMGEMNSLDLRLTPVNYQRGLFVDWWERVGMGHSFDVLLAEQAFGDMLAEAGVRVITGAGELLPLFALNTETGRADLSGPVGVQVDGTNYLSRQLIDATAEGDFAAAAGAQSTFGFSSIGLDERMADTLVFRIDGVDWAALTVGIRARGGAYASVNEFVAWGHFGGYPANYVAEEPGIRLRGLNMGRQLDGTLLVNALLIHDIDPFDPESLAEGRARADREAPRIVEYLARELPGFQNAFHAGSAETLYIRETRHLIAECILTVDDVMENRVTDRAIAAGGYPLDVQVLTPQDNGYVFGTPVIYGVELCVTVPRGLSNVWVVGKAAGYDPIAHSSARVVPLGMVVAEAAGVAAAAAARQLVTPAVFAADSTSINWLRGRLLERGAYLPPVQTRNPLGPHEHPHYRDYRLLLGRGLALGGYENQPRLDEQSGALSYVYMLSNVGKRFLGDADLGQFLVATYPFTSEQLTPDLALDITLVTACQLGGCLGDSWDDVRAAGIGAGIAPGSLVQGGVLTRGQMYALAAGIARVFGGH